MQNRGSGKRILALVLTVAVIPLLAGTGLWFLSYFFWAKSADDPHLMSLAWAILGWVVVTLISLVLEFIVALRRFDSALELTRESFARAAGDFSTQVARVLAPQILQLLEAPDHLQRFWPLAKEISSRALAGAFTEERYVRWHNVPDVEYCRLLREACGLAREAMFFTCLESPHWFMLNESRQVHLEAMSASQLEEGRKTRLVILSEKSEAHLLSGSAAEFSEANLLPQVQAIPARDRIRWERDGTSEVSWFIERSLRTKLLWSLAGHLAGLTELGGAFEDFAIFDGVFYLSYDFEHHVLSCAWDPVLVRRCLSVQALVERPGASGTLFYESFYDLPGLPEDVRNQYRAELAK